MKRNVKHRQTRVYGGSLDLFQCSSRTRVSFPGRTLPKHPGSHVLSYRLKYETHERDRPSTVPSSFGVREGLCVSGTGAGLCFSEETPVRLKSLFQTVYTCKKKKEVPSTFARKV